MTSETVYLNAICEQLTVGHVGVTSEYYCDSSVGVPFIRTQNVTSAGFNDEDIKFITPEFHASLKKTQLRGNDVLLSRVVVDEMRCAIVPENYGDANCANVILIRPGPKLLPEYLVYLIQSPQSQKYLLGKRKGAAQQVVNTGILKSWKINTPSIEIQKKIVKKLDAIFAEIDKAIAATEANIKNAEALFQSYLNQVFEENFSNKKKLKDCCHIKPPKSEAKALNPDDEVSFMPMEALGINEKFAIPNQVRKLSDVSGSYTYFAEGDVLLAKITPCFENGKLGIAKDLINGVGFGSSEYIVFRPGIELDSSWLYYFLNRSEFRNNGAKHMSGAVGHKRVTKEFIEDLVIPLPTILRQSEIISEIENISNITNFLKSSNSHKLIELNQLKQSILNQAFNNELVKE
jgi:type I restriction enzyme S subunit